MGLRVLALFLIAIAAVGVSSGRAVAADGEHTLEFTHFANGTGTTSELVFVNVADYSIRPQIYFYDQRGDLIVPGSLVDLTGDLAIREDGSLTVRTEMEPFGKLTITTHGRGEPVSGSVRAVSNGPIAGLVRYTIPNVGVTEVGPGRPLQDALFLARRRREGISTVAALHNLGKEAIALNCQLMSGGVTLEEAEIPLEANGHTSWFIQEVFTATDTSDFLGSVRCNAPGEGRFSAIAVEIDPGQRVFDTLSVLPVDQIGGVYGQTILDFPHIANGTWITHLVFLNTETRPSGPSLIPFHAPVPPSRPTIHFYNTQGNPIAPDALIDIAGGLEITEDGALTVQTEMLPLGIVVLSTHGRGKLVTGSARVVSEGRIGAMVGFEHPDFGVAWASAGLPVHNAIFQVRRRKGETTTGIALHNLESSPVLLRCDLMSKGVLLDSIPIPLLANGQTSWSIEDAFATTDTSEFLGLVHCAMT